MAIWALLGIEISARHAKTCCYTVCKHDVKPVVPVQELHVLGHETAEVLFSSHNQILAQG